MRPIKTNAAGSVPGRPSNSCSVDQFRLFLPPFPQGPLLPAGPRSFESLLFRSHFRSLFLSSFSSLSDLSLSRFPLPRSATALSHEACRLFVLKRADLEDLLFVDRDLAYELLWKFVRTLSRRLRATNDKMTFLATTNKF